MKRSEYIENELNELGIKLLLEIPKTVPFTVPSNYFSGLHENIVLKLERSDEIDFVVDGNKKSPFTKPDTSYFDNLSTQILAKINSEELNWGKSNPFTVPNNYFEQFPATVIENIKQHKAIKRSLRFPIFKNLQLAASIALFIFVGLGVLKMSYRKASNKFNFDDVTQAEISAYVHENIDDFDTDIVLNGLSYTKVIPNEILTNQVSNEEIKQYLNEEGMK